MSRYQLSLEEVTGPEDDEHVEYVGVWSLAKGEWKLGPDLWASIKEAYRGRR